MKCSECNVNDVPDWRQKYCDGCATKKANDYKNKEKQVPHDRETITGSVEVNAPKPTDEPRDHKFDKDPVGLAVDIFIISLGKFEDGVLDIEGAKTVMKQCTDLVKQAIKEFE